MRVLHIGKYFPPFAGGIENYCGDLIPALEPLGIQCHALVHSHQAKSETQQEGPLPADVTRCPTWFELAFTPISPSFRGHFKRLLRDWQPDLLHFHLPNPSAFWAMTIAAANRVPWLVHWHSDVVTSPHDRRLRLLYPWYRPFEQRFLRHSQAIVATSSAYADSSEALHNHQAKIKIVPLGVAAERLTDEYSQQLPAAIWPTPTGLRLLAIGRLTYYKGFDILLRAVASIDDAQLVIVGGGTEADNLRATITQLRVADRVELRGEVDDATRNSLLSDCDVFCLPSIERTEAFGLVLLEAMHAGKPVIASRIEGSGVPWVVERGANGLLCPPGDISALAAAIDKLRDSATRLQLTKQAERRFAEQFAIERSAASIAQIYRELVSRSKS